MTRALVLTLLLVSTPAWAGPYDAPSETELRAAVDCVGRMTGMKAPARLPIVVISDRVALAENASETLADGRTIKGHVFGQYSPTRRQIELGATWQWPQLAHEIVHFLQHQNGLYPVPLPASTRARLESQAYDVQAHFQYTCMSFWGQVLEMPQR